MTDVKMNGQSPYSINKEDRAEEHNPTEMGDDSDLNHSFDKVDNEDADQDRTIPDIKTKIQLSWHDISIRAEPPAGCCGKKGVGVEKTIIDNISGSALPGQFISIIGASGAGKTTLLNFLSGRLISKGLTKEGTVKINGVESDQVKGFQQFSAYVQQDDVLMQSMTVRECLLFAAKLKLPGTEQDKIARVDELILDLKLKKCRNSFIGGPLLKGVSGGERKRTSIGVELVTNPSLIFLDEPTTGLDSYTATQVMKMLSKLAKSGRTVVQTIHQPNSEIFGLFDKLMLLSCGKIIYFNDADKSINYFKEIGYPCPSLSNPADFFMSMMSIESLEIADASPDRKKEADGENTVEKRYKAQIAEFVEQYQNSSLNCQAHIVDPTVKTLTDEDI